MNSARKELISQVCAGNSNAKLHALDQTTTVLLYVKKIKNVVFEILYISKDEKIGNFCADLKLMIQLDVLDASHKGFKYGDKIMLSLDSALDRV